MYEDKWLKADVNKYSHRAYDNDRGFSVKKTDLLHKNRLYDWEQFKQGMRGRRVNILCRDAEYYFVTEANFPSFMDAASELGIAHRFNPVN